jgi:protocatechuate 3,4-dioxygenase beta subunit
MRTLLLFLTLVAAGQEGASRTSEAGTAAVRGQVTDRETGKPVSGAHVTLTGPPPRTSVTRANEEGRYEFADLPAGRYTLGAGPAEFRATHVWAHYVDPDSDGLGPTPIILKGGEIRTGIDVSLTRAYAVSGRVLDEWGIPVANAGIRLTDLQTGGAGGRGHVPTDDRGLFRAFGVAPGRYRLCAEPRMFVSFSPEGHSDHQADAPIRTCYPSVTAVDDAQPITVRNADVGGLEIRMLRAPVVMISGVVLSANGTPVPDASVMLMRIEEDGGYGSGSVARADGSFKMTGVIPGQYVLKVERRPPASPYDDPSLEEAHVPITVDGEHVSQLVLTLSKPRTVSGRIVFENDAPPAPRGQNSWMVFAEPERPEVRFTGSFGRPAAVSETLSFELRGLLGRVRLAMTNLPDGWIVKQVRYKGQDIRASYTEFQDGENIIDIVLTKRGGIVSGRVIDDRGAPAGGARVVIFPADPAERKALGAGSPVPIASDGTYRNGPRLAGDYLIIAAQLREGRRWSDPKLLEQLVPFAERITLLENDRRTVDLRVIKVE